MSVALGWRLAARGPLAWMLTLGWTWVSRHPATRWSRMSRWVLLCTAQLWCVAVRGRLPQVLPYCAGILDFVRSLRCWDRWYACIALGLGGGMALPAGRPGRLSSAAAGTAGTRGRVWFPGRAARGVGGLGVFGCGFGNDASGTAGVAFGSRLSSDAATGLSLVTGLATGCGLAAVCIELLVAFFSAAGASSVLCSVAWADGFGSSALSSTSLGLQARVAASTARSTGPLRPLSGPSVRPFRSAARPCCSGCPVRAVGTRPGSLCERSATSAPFSSVVPAGTLACAPTVHRLPTCPSTCALRPILESVPTDACAASSAYGSMCARACTAAWRPILALSPQVTCSPMFAPGSTSTFGPIAQRSPTVTGSGFPPRSAFACRLLPSPISELFADRGALFHGHVLTDVRPVLEAALFRDPASGLHDARPSHVGVVADPDPVHENRAGSDPRVGSQRCAISDHRVGSDVCAGLDFDAPPYLGSSFDSCSGVDECARSDSRARCDNRPLSYPGGSVDPRSGLAFLARLTVSLPGLAADGDGVFVLVGVHTPKRIDGHGRSGVARPLLRPQYRGFPRDPTVRLWLDYRPQ